MACAGASGRDHHTWLSWTTTDTGGGEPTDEGVESVATGHAHDHASAQDFREATDSQS